MKILHIYKNYYPYSLGGVERHLQSLTESLYQSGVNSTILTTYQGEKVRCSQVGQIPVYYFPANLEVASCPISLALLKKFRELAQSFDILHFHFPWPFADILPMLTRLNKPMVVTYHSDIVRQKWLKLIYQPVMRHFLNRADAIIASSNNYVNSSPVLKNYAHKISVIPYGLSDAQFPQPSNEIIEYWRQRLGQDFFLFIGVLRYYKGLDYLLEAVRNTPFKMVIAGSGGEEARLLELQKTKNINNVFFIGKITEQDKAALYQLCRATVSSAHLRTEAFCISLLESLIYGKPAISTELNTGTSFVNRHNISGLVVPPADPDAIRKAMESLTSDEKLYQSLRQGTQTHYQEYFTLEKMRDKHIQLYEKFIKPE